MVYDVWVKVRLRLRAESVDYATSLCRNIAVGMVRDIKCTPDLVATKIVTVGDTQTVSQAEWVKTINYTPHHRVVFIDGRARFEQQMGLDGWQEVVSVPCPCSLASMEWVAGDLPDGCRDTVMGILKNGLREEDL